MQEQKPLQDIKLTFKRIGRTCWPVGLFIVYIITQLALLFNQLGLAVIITLTMAVLVIRYQKVPPRHFRRFKYQWPIKIIIVVIMLIALLSAIAGLHWLMLQLHVKSITSNNQQVLNELFQKYRLVACFDTLIMAPVFEEGVFRLGLISFKNNRKLLFTSIGSTLLFAVCHISGSINPWVLCMYLLPGIALTITYVWTRDVKCSMLLHLLYNSLALAALL